MRQDDLTDTERKLRACLLSLYRASPEGPLRAGIHQVLCETHRPGMRVHALDLPPGVCGTLIERDGTEWKVRGDNGALVRWSEGAFEDAPPRPSGPNAWKEWPVACAQAPERYVCVPHARYACPSCIEDVSVDRKPGANELPMNWHATEQGFESNDRSFVDLASGDVIVGHADGESIHVPRSVMLAALEHSQSDQIEAIRIAMCSTTLGGELIDPADPVRSVQQLMTRMLTLDSAMAKLSDIRDSIIGMQGFNFSEHAYLMAEILDSAGYRGHGYETSVRNFGTLLQQRDDSTLKLIRVCERFIEACPEIGTEWCERNVPELGTLKVWRDDMNPLLGSVEWSAFRIPGGELKTYAKAAENALRRIATACGFERTHDYPLQIVADVEQRLGELESSKSLLRDRTQLALKMLMVGDEAIRMLEGGGANETLEMLKQARENIDDLELEAPAEGETPQEGRPLGLVFPCPFCAGQRRTLQIVDRGWACHRCHAETTPQGRAALLYFVRGDMSTAPRGLQLRAIIPSICEDVPPGYFIKKMEATTGAGAQPERWLVFPEAWHYEHPDRAIAIREALLHAAAARHRGEIAMPDLGGILALQDVLTRASVKLTALAGELGLAAAVADLQARPVMSELRPLTLAEARRFFPVGTKVTVIAGNMSSKWFYDDVVEREAELVGELISVGLEKHGLWSASELFVKLPPVS